VTWFQRVLLAVDVALILWLWPVVRDPVGASGRPPSTGVRYILPVVVLAFSVIVVVFPGEFIYRFVHTPLTFALFEQHQAGALQSPFTNVIIAPNVVVPKSTSLAGRNLRQAVLAGSRMKGVDLRGSIFVSAEDVVPGSHTLPLQIELPDGIQLVRANPGNVRVRIYRQKRAASG